MEKVAVISDIHGNLEALKAVLSDIEARKITKIICLGDVIGKGLHPYECIQLVQKSCFVSVMGNYCYSLLHEDLVKNHEIERILWCKNQLAEEDIEYIQKMPYCYEMYISGRLVRFFHATPDNIYKIVGDIGSVEDHYNLFLPTKNTISMNVADVVVYGYVHMQYLKRMYNRTIINTGSVGNSIDVFRNKEKDGDVKNTTVANYLILSGNLHSKNSEESFSYEFISVPYNIEKELEMNHENVESEDYEEEIRNGCYRNMEMVYQLFEHNGINRNQI